jgi:4-hydroxy-4-methyl-2-oxoglutarate aldolase
MCQFNSDVVRTPAHLVERFLAFETATVYEVNQKQGALSTTIRCLFPGTKMAGTALTLHAAIAMAQPGDVIVADVGGYTEAGHWGEITTAAAQHRGVVGLVINGGVRDIAAIRPRGFPIFAAAVCMKATVKAVPGRINHPISCGGVTIEAGDLVLGDDDDVVVVPRTRVEAVLTAAQQKTDAEAEVIRHIEQGELTLDILGFRQILAAHQLSI